MNKIISAPLCSIVLFISLIVSATQAQAAVTPLAFSIVAPVQFPSEEFTVAGARASVLWGNHRSVYGVDLGLLGNVTSLKFVGLAVSGIANVTYGQTTILGVQLAGITNINTQKTEVYGLQIAAGVNRNTAASSINGLQVALLANLSQFTTINGAQVGLYNHAQTVRGLQIGLVNVATSLKGVQIGLLNYHKQGTVSVSPFLNIGF